MTSLLSYLLTFFGIGFWIFRAIATVLYQLDYSFFATPLNVNVEIAILFLTLPCMILIVKRNIIGAACYVGIYVSYFGTALYEALVEMQVTGITIVSSSNLFCIFLGVLIPILTFLDILFNKHRTLGNGKKKQDWFYANEKYDREFDERADRNQYKF